jgi:hypothetical protein
MFYNGFNLMIDAILVASTAMYMSWKLKREFNIDIQDELAYEYNEGWETGYETALSDKERNAVFRPLK